ncbi:MAG: hypothetical protein KGI68_02000 [Alphaproteobacteria bacterium]|nr:hypothetical protein [Alphaproteobacteria bacterium]
MQISAANLLVASQQQAKPSAQPAPTAFAAALAEEKSAFEPLPFKSAAAPAQAAPTQAKRPQPSQPAALGSHIDIRV